MVSSKAATARSASFIAARNRRTSSARIPRLRSAFSRRVAYLCSSPSISSVFSLSRSLYSRRLLGCVDSSLALACCSSASSVSAADRGVRLLSSSPWIFWWRTLLPLRFVASSTGSYSIFASSSAAASTLARNTEELRALPPPPPVSQTRSSSFSSSSSSSGLRSDGSNIFFLLVGSVCGWYGGGAVGVLMNIVSAACDDLIMSKLSHGLIADGPLPPTPLWTRFTPP
mmetsp:Transcript_20171/g.48461  ORF Transcript_20171/g.48461 Transcript_20171/m.48461 type:complete len:228 (+) Transcript_20171:1-684(+)